jgi:hypothetical protein
MWIDGWPVRITGSYAQGIFWVGKQSKPRNVVVRRHRSVEDKATEGVQPVPRDPWITGNDLGKAATNDFKRKGLVEMCEGLVIGQL